MVDPALAGDPSDPVERQAEVLMDVVCKRLERRDVEAVDAVFEFACPRPDEDVVDDREERREGLSRPGRRADEDVLSLVDERDRHPLRRGEPPVQFLYAPFPYVLVEEIEDLLVRMLFRPLLHPVTSCRPLSPAVRPPAYGCGARQVRVIPDLLQVQESLPASMLQGV